MTVTFNLIIKRGGSKKTLDKDQFKIMRTDNTLSDTIKQTHASKCKIQNFQHKTNKPQQNLLRDSHQR